MLRTISRDQRLDELTEKVAIIIPTLNEERSVGSVIDSVPVHDLLEHGFRTFVYVIDGLSVDHTREIAAQKGAQLVTEKKPGKGAAIQKAFRVVDADYVIVVDGDDTYPISAAFEILRLLHTHDVVIGSRFKGFIEPRAMTRLNVVGNKLLTLFARVLFHDNISDVCTGLWGFRRDAIDRLKLHARGFEIEVDIYSETVRNGLTRAEIPIHYRARKDQAKLASLRDGLRIAAFLFRKRLLIMANNRETDCRQMEMVRTPGPENGLRRPASNNLTRNWGNNSEFTDEWRPDPETCDSR